MCSAADNDGTCRRVGGLILEIGVKEDVGMDFYMERTDL